MRQQFHRCRNLRVIALDAEDLGPGRGRGRAVLEELCEAKHLARCLGLAECDILSRREKRELLAVRVTRMREEEGGASPLGELSGERGRRLLELRQELLEERAEIVRENQALLAEATAAEGGDLRAAPSDEADFAGLGISLRGGSEELRELGAARLDAIDRGLEFMRRPGYGICARCREPVSLESLRHAPDTRLCAPCAKQAVPVA